MLNILRKAKWILIVGLISGGMVYLVSSLIAGYKENASKEPEWLQTRPEKTYTGGDYSDGGCAAKPVIYLYPEEPMQVEVTLEYDGDLTCTYPAYNVGWKVMALPDGTLTDAVDGKVYSYLFWEGIDQNEYDFSSGFVVPGEDTAEFLQEKLSYLGLTPKEYNEMIVYWLPKMQENVYNLIAFQQEAYTDHARLSITPEPDSVLRVFMTYIPLEEPVEIPEQKLEAFERNGFTVVEWGGSEIEKDD